MSDDEMRGLIERIEELFVYTTNRAVQAAPGPERTNHRKAAAAYATILLAFSTMKGPDNAQ